QLVNVTNGFAELLPHKVYLFESLNSPNGPVVTSIRTQDDLLANVVVGNPVLPVPQFPEQATLPNGLSGNHFLAAKFSADLDLDSVLSSNPALQGSNSFTGSIIVSAIDAATGSASVIHGRAFINGYTFGTLATGSPAALPLQRWIGDDGQPLEVDTDNDGIVDGFPGVGFPGTEGVFSGSADLTLANTLVFVMDEDGNLATHETFPVGVQVVMEIKSSVRDVLGRPLRDAGLASATVGSDSISPEVRSTPPPTSHPLITPAFNAEDVDPLTSILVEYSEPVQPLSVGDLLSTPVPGLSSSVGVSFGPQTNLVNVPFNVRPISVYDLTRWELIPIFNFPGSGPSFNECGVFSRVDITFNSGNLIDLAGNLNTLPGSSYFSTGEGPGIVNAPITPDAVYVGRSGGQPGISVMDLNGFGAGTGNPTFDPANPIVQGNSNFPNDPNVKVNSVFMTPPLSAGTCTVDGGSAGVFTLTLDSSLQDRVVRTPFILAVGDMALGQALDTTFNNAPAPFGCQGQGGNLCAADGLKRIVTTLSGNSIVPSAGGGGAQVVIEGGPNIVSWAPHPNPPPLIYPPLCVSPFLGSQEPTSIDTLAVVGNLLVSGGNPLGDPSTGTPPSTLLARQSNVFFQGPSPVPGSLGIGACSNYGLRQQLGQYLYMIDRARNEIVIFNSNRMTVIDRILIPDPTSIAFGTNVDTLAVTSQSSNSVFFIDTDPASSGFHQVFKTVAVGDSPRGICWEPGNEDILVVNEGSNTMSIISAFSFEVRRVVSSGLNSPFEIAVTPRQVGFGFSRNVYFAYIINRTGRVNVFESGPNGVNGWGYDDIVGALPMEFLNPKTIHSDHVDLRSSLWIVHEGPLDQTTGLLSGSPSEGALTNIVAESGTFGQLLLSTTSLQTPQLRDIAYAIKISMGEERLSGVPVDICFDNQVNLGALPNFFTNFSAGAAAPLNGKSIVRGSGAGGAPTNSPSFLFAAIPTPNQGLGGIDAIGLASGAFLRFDTNPYDEGVQSIPAPGVTILMDYFRQ
ncbi:MAG: hypothetical protein ACI9F9_002934, partial [Candidatus Paceibacteria bacterium]